MIVKFWGAFFLVLFFKWHQVTHYASISWPFLYCRLRHIVSLDKCQAPQIYSLKYSLNVRSLLVFFLRQDTKKKDQLVLSQFLLPHNISIFILNLLAIVEKLANTARRHLSKNNGTKRKKICFVVFTKTADVEVNEK